MRRTSNRTEPRLLAVVGGLLGALVASGCAAMPDSGGITRVELSQGSADKDLQARVYPVAPARGAKPRELLNGFLDAVTADEGYDTARKYLTESAAATWNPDAGTKVLSATGIPVGQDVTDADTTASLQVSGQLVAGVDERHSYARVAGQNNDSSDFTFVRQKDGEWRIDRLAPGVIMNETNFRNSFRQVERFFYTAPDPSSVVSGSAGQEVLLADPVYLRRRIDPLTSAVRALVDGPSVWLSPVVRTAFPAGTTVDKVSIDDNRVAHVQLGKADTGEPMACRRMATQLFYTVADQGKGQITRLELKGPHGSCTAARGDSPSTGPGALAGSTTATQYYQRADGALVATDEVRPGDPVRGVLGKPQSNTKPPLGAFAVSRTGSQAAAISEDGHQVWSVPLSDSAVAMGEPVLTSPAKGGDKEDGFASPTWDGRGDLWVVDRNKQAPRVVMVRGAKSYTVPVEGLTGQTVQALKISSDGVRVAVVARTPGSAVRSLWFGLVVHDGTPQAPTVKITALHRAAPTLTDVASVSWAETDQLLVLGKEADRTQQLYFISTDGSQSTETQLQSAESMLTVSASESRGDSLTQTPPVLAMGEVKQTDGKPSEIKAFRLVNNQWRETSLIDKPRSFFYAG
ncbi:LpqB family beta-propeller domain-containing protein [Kitasatospora xanthocidica]|uniref:LpqB family beta-propeller domain-containing protein n=1 Tax=Kitasatospora xanthocidica TaxID=83382 RepID=UPI0011C42A39|nr:LpqB family beta-propeller domain-containing protein [Kitasatospora xanthocidica]